MKFDWYQASVPDVPPEVVMQALARSEYYGEWVESKASKGYDVGAHFVVGDQVKYKIRHGGQNADFGSNVTATGGDAPKLAEVLRQAFPRHRVSRVDSCEDFHHAEAYPYLRGIGLRIAKQFNVAVREITKPLPESDDGCTLYIGSEKSAISGRIYEKAKQLRVGSEWVRVELQVRPQKRVKDVAAMLSPEDMWGLGKWTRALASEIGQTQIQRVDVQIYQPSDDERAYRHMLKQYGKLFQRLRATHGSPETVGAQIFYDLDHPDQQATKTSIRAVLKAAEASKK
jgi:DNA relaxase NicK